ncbi:MAG TPA: STAS/SEC14 domain-containing protein [Gemmatimonadaceae bacterium]|nr:STAS/SEC14 domain-containing protein [Gemmatimonadaceae bacterium]
MPVALSFEEPSTFCISTSGAVTFDEVERLIGDLEADPRLTCGIRVLVDARAVSDVPTTSELRTIAADLGRLVPRGMQRIAVVTESTFVYGIARMFAVFADAVCITVHPFRCMSDATAWLALPHDAAA